MEKIKNLIKIYGHLEAVGVDTKLCAFQLDLIMEDIEKLIAFEKREVFKTIDGTTTPLKKSDSIGISNRPDDFYSNDQELADATKKYLEFE